MFAVVRKGPTPIVLLAPHATVVEIVCMIVAGIPVTTQIVSEVSLLIADATCKWSGPKLLSNSPARQNYLLDITQYCPPNAFNIVAIKKKVYVSLTVRWTTYSVPLFSSCNLAA